MAIKTNDTTTSSEKVVRSHLSQAYSNAVNGVFIDPDGTEIKATKIKEPSVLISKSELEISPLPGVAVPESGLENLGSFRISRETISDLRSMLDMRELEKFVDGWFSSGYELRAPEIGGVPYSEIVNSIVSGLKLEISASKKLCKYRAELIGYIQNFIIDTQRRKILMSTHPKFMPGGGNYEEKLRSYWDYSGLFSPHALKMINYATKEFIKINDPSNSSDEVLDALEELGLLNLTAQSTCSQEFRYLNERFGLGSEPYILDNTYHSTSIILCLIDWISLTVDHGYTPIFGALPNSLIVEPKELKSLKTRLVMVEKNEGGGQIIRYPKLKDIGMYAETRSGFQTPVFDPNIQQLPFGTLPGDQGPIGNLSPYDPSLPNLTHGSIRNPAVRVKRRLDNLTKLLTNKQGQVPPEYADIQTIAHICSMLKSESLQSSGILSISSEVLPSVNSRINPITQSVKGIGEVLFTPEDRNPLKAGSPTADSPLCDIVSDTNTINNTSTYKKPFLPFERGLNYLGLSQGNLDIYDVYLKDVLDSETYEVNRRNRINKIHDTFKRKMVKLKDGVEAIEQLFAFDKIDSESNNGNDTYTSWPKNNAPPDTVSPDRPGGGTTELFGYLISRPVESIRANFWLSETTQTSGFPFTYWSSENAIGIKRDRQFIAQISGLIGSIKQVGSMDSSDRENLRSAIVEAIINRDLKNAIVKSDGKNRVLGYYQTIAKKQSEQVSVDTTLDYNAFVQPTGYSRNAVKNFVAKSNPQSISTVNSPNGQLNFFDVDISTNTGNQINLEKNVRQQVRTSLQSLGVPDSSDVYFPGYYNGPQGFEVAQSTSFSYDQGVTPDQAATTFMQGGVRNSYRITKYSSTIDFVHSILGLNDPDVEDLYDEILDCVDVLDTFFASNHATYNSGNSNSPVNVDSSFGDFQSSLGIQPGNFWEESGISKANAFDRSTLISIVVDVFARVLNMTFRIDMGSTDSALSYDNPNSLVNLQGWAIHPWVVEVTTADGLYKTTNTDTWDQTTLIRNRAADHIAAFDEGAVPPWSGPAYLWHDKSYTSFDNQTRIFSAVKKTLLEVNRELVGHNDTLTIQDLGSLIARNACRRETVGSTMFTVNPISKENFDEVDLNSSVPELLEEKPYKNFKIMSWSYPNDPEKDKIIIRESGGIGYPTISNPFGSLGADLWPFSFGVSTQSFPIGKGTVGKFLEVVAGSALFCSVQESAPIRGALALEKFISNHYLSSEDMRDALETFRTKIDPYIQPDASLKIKPPEEVSKHQIVSKLSYLNEMMHYINNIGIEAGYPALLGGRTYKRNYFFNLLAKKFLDDLDSRLKAKNQSSKTFYFYGIKPNEAYSRITAESERPINNISFVYKKGKYAGQESFGTTISFSYSGKSGLESGIKYMQKFPGYDTHFDLDFKIIEGVLYKKLQDIGVQDLSQREYDNILEEIPFMRVKSISTNGIDAPGQYKGTGYTEGWYTTYSEAFKGATITEDTAKLLFKRKLDAWCLKYIIDQVAGVCLDENHLGLEKSKLSSYRLAFLVPTGDDFKWRDKYFDINKSPASQRPYDDEFKRALNPILKVEVGEPKPKLYPPEIGDLELFVGELFSNANIVRDYTDIGNILYDEVIALDFDPEDDLEIDQENTDAKFKDGNLQVKSTYADLIKSGIFVVDPKFSVRILYP